MDIGIIIQEYCIPIIVAFCYCVGFGLKKASFFNDRYIPIVVIVLGAISGMLINGIDFQNFIRQTGRTEGPCRPQIETHFIHYIFSHFTKQNILLTYQRINETGECSECILLLFYTGTNTEKPLLPARFSRKVWLFRKKVLKCWK